MSFINNLDQAFEFMLVEYPKGIASTSTAKYKNIVALLAEALDVSASSIYATGAMKRVTNLDTRLAQGNLRNQHTPVAIVFIGGYDRTRDPGFEGLRRSAIATCSKFVDGRERGTTFDDIIVLAQEDRHVVPVALLSADVSRNRSRILELLPDLKLEKVVQQQTDIGSAVERSSVTPLFSSGPAQARQVALSSALVDDCAKALRSSGIQCEPLMIRRYVAALLVKRFVILTGLAGSGKTRLAQAVARWLAPAEEHVSVIAVGADWTTAEYLLGYPDALHTASYRRPLTGALDFLLRASSDRDKPYFLILDEMNLSHVERYFADILSSMESGEPLRLHGSDSQMDGVPPKLPFPSNVFVIGTVNVDETTYLFSPKVLDRANVLEFRVEGADLVAFLENPRPIEIERLAAAGRDWAESFVAAANDRDVAPDESVAEAVRTTIRELFDEFALANMEFGFRTAFDIWRFVGLFQKLSPVDFQVDDAIDAQIVQKLLPKLHGSERRLRPILEKLREYCGTRNFADSSEKIDRMLRRLGTDGFTSFAEA